MRLQMVNFEDGKRSVDYVIAVKEENLPLIRQYVGNLEGQGLQFEVADGIEVPMKFLKVHVPKTALDHFSQVHDIGNEDQKVEFYHRSNYGVFNFVKTPISEVPRPQIGEFVDSQKIGIVNKILENARFGDGPYDVGLTKLTFRKIIVAAYPLHCGSLDEQEGTENDRQLLLKYFASSKMWYKEMPLDKIKDYFGHEVAFYFAWLEFFDVMLIFPTILGTVLILVIFFTLLMDDSNPTISEICRADDVHLCPSIITGREVKFKTLSAACTLAKIQYVFDNYLSISFAVVMSFWATVFLNYWRRKESELRLRWGVNYDLSETQIRSEYLQKIGQENKDRKKFSSKIKPILRMLFSFFICFLLVMVVIAAVIIVIILKIFLKWALNKYGNKHIKDNSQVLSMCIGSTVQVIFIKIFGKMYGKVSLWLTDIENPKTQSDYDNSVLYKRYLLAFVNNYSPLFYIAFFKGRFYTMPHKVSSYISVLERDICDPVSCIPPLCIGLGFIMIFKKLTGNMLSYASPYTNMVCKVLCCKKVKIKKNKLPQWEEEFDLLPTNRFMLTTEFTEMVIQYGFVTFFVAALPLAPLFCLLNNLMEARLDAYKLVTRFRRPVPMKKSGVGPWNGVLLGLTFLSVTTNGFVIAFTSDMVPREMYRIGRKRNLEGFVNSTLSRFATKKLVPSCPISSCYYRGKRYDPTHKMAYQLTDEYWKEITWRLIVVFIFEHIIFICTAVLDYAIPDVPSSVKMQLNKDKSLAREEKLATLAETVRRGRTMGELGARLKGIIGYGLPAEAPPNKPKKWKDLPPAPPIQEFL